MPFRYHPTGAALSAQQLLVRTAAWSSHRSFHASSRLRRDAATSNLNTTNHYETLNVRPDASPAEIKKSFYHLSKRHHPDHNPSDPHAPARFMHISEAYATLSHADKRARYDRDVMRHLHHSTRTNPHYHHHPAHKGSSFHSTGPAGGRPASGLSRRRGTYQGPPPSFYRSGGWGAHGTKRRAAHEESTGTGAGFGTNSHSHQGKESGSGSGYHPPPPPPPPPPPGGSSGGGVFGTGGMGPGQDPFGHHHDVPHFDREAHLRAQKRSDDRRAHKIARDRGVNIDQFETATNVSFFGMAAILVCIVMIPFMLSNLRDKGNGTGNGSGSSSNGDKARERERERERKAR